MGVKGGLKFGDNDESVGESLDIVLTAFVMYENSKLYPGMIAWTKA